MTELFFEGEKVDPEDRHACNAIRLALYWKVFEVAKKDVAYMAFGSPPDEDEGAQAMALCPPDCEGQLASHLNGAGFMPWSGVPVEQVIQLYDWTWKVGNTHGEISVVDQLARAVDPHHLTLRDRDA